MTDRPSDAPSPGRRATLAALTGMVAGLAGLPALGESEKRPPPIRAIAFDGFPIFDPRSIEAVARSRLGDRGDLLARAWTQKLFGYTWLATAAGQYRSFLDLADMSLRYTAEAAGIVLNETDRQAMVEQYGQLDVWPDVVPALRRLRAAGIRLAFLSNLSEATLAANLALNGIADLFEPSLSTDRVKRFKPAPEAYAMALDAFGLPREQIGFAAFGGWDAVGATWFGYQTVWVNRFGLPQETIAPPPFATSRDMTGVLALAGIR